MKPMNVYEDQALVSMVEVKCSVIEERSSLIWGATRMASTSYLEQVKTQLSKVRKVGQELFRRLQETKAEVERLREFNDNQREQLERCLQRIKLLEGENDVLKQTNAALWSRFLGNRPAVADLHNDVVVHTVDQVLRQLGDGTAQGHYDDASVRGTPGDGHWFG